jgi:hypothetical protein
MEVAHSLAPVCNIQTATLAASRILSWPNLLTCLTYGSVLLACDQPGIFRMHAAKTILANWCRLTEDPF